VGQSTGGAFYSVRKKKRGEYHHLFNTVPEICLEMHKVKLRYKELRENDPLKSKVGREKEIRLATRPYREFVTIREA